MYEKNDNRRQPKKLGQLTTGWYFPCEPTNFVRRKFSKSQEILKNMHKISKELDEY